jgi:predicted deacylase
MSSRKPLVVGGQRIRLGESKQVQLKFSETYLGQEVFIPAYIMRAKKNGPRVFLTATIHGDELNGVGILRELLYDTPPALVCGSLIMLPVVNVYGMENHTRYLPDRRDLNRSFPGSEDGSLSSRLARVIFHEVVTQCDYGIDFHTAAVRRTNFPNVRADLTNKEARMLAHAFGCELIVNGKGSEGTLRRTSTESGVPTIILEAGEVWKIEPGVQEIGVRGILNVLKTLGMVRGEPEQPRFQVSSKRTTWVRAERGGILGYHVKPGDLVNEGQVIATNYNIFGQEHRSLKSPVDGVILGMTTMPAVKPGQPVFHVAKLPPNVLKRVRREVDNLSSSHAFSRMQDDLARSIVVLEN